MGANSSSLSELASNEYLKRLSGTDVITSIDPFWNQLLSFSLQIPRTSADQRLLEESTTAICKNFAINNCRTGNFASLIHVFLLRATELKASAQCENNVFTWQTYNALFIIRNLCMYFVENLSEEVIVQQFEMAQSQEEGTKKSEVKVPLYEELMNCLIEVLVDVPVLDFTHALHLECLNTLLILLSVQMFQPVSASLSHIYSSLMQGKCGIHACVFMKTLVQNYIKQEKSPPELLRNGVAQPSRLYGLTTAVASSLWTVLTLGMSTKGEKPEEYSSDTLLADQSLLLILILANHCTTETGLRNPYRQALFSFTNSQDSSDSSPMAAVATFKVDFSQLYDTLCHTLKGDETTLLLYLLMHKNQAVRAFILSRTNIDQLVVPLLKILYHAQERNSHHIYMALIVLLILSEDDCFNKAVHETVLKNVPWFKERQVTDISLGGILILVVIRTIQYNMTRMRDKYLHTNCLAALANMSSQFCNLHPYVTQRIVSLFALLRKKHLRLVDQIRDAATDASVPQHDVQSGSGSGSELEPEQDADTEAEYLQDLVALEEVVRMVLEIINSCLTHSLQHNPNLVYTLLYQKALFDHFRTHPTFQDIIQNIDLILSYFSAKLDTCDKNISVPEVLQIVKQGAVQFRKDRLKKFPELKFRYVEEDQPEEFFIPYVWSLVFHTSNLYFNPSRIRLFSLQGAAS